MRRYFRSVDVMRVGKRMGVIAQYQITRPDGSQQTRVNPNFNIRIKERDSLYTLYQFKIV